MEEISSAVAVPFSLGTLIRKDSAVTTHMEMTGIKIMANTAALILNPAMEGWESYSSSIESHTDVSPPHEIIASEERKENLQAAAASVSEMIVECDKNWILNKIHDNISKKDELISPIGNSSGQKSSTLNNNISEIDSSSATKVGDNLIGMSNLNEPHMAVERAQNMVSIAMEVVESEDGSGSDGLNPKQSELPNEKKIRKTSLQNTIELSDRPLWGFSSICGRRPEMEDAVAVVPQLLQIPSHMLMDERVTENIKKPVAHFFGVYDGHGGSQVCLKFII